MPKISYQYRKFNEQHAGMIQHANRILHDYDQQGYVLTLRQLYYQFVAHDLFPDDRKWALRGSKWVRSENGTKNAEPNYKWLGELMNSARLAGEIDWSLMEDRTRNLQFRSAWNNPQEILSTAAASYHINRWDNQSNYVEVWIEKDALAGVFANVCHQFDVPYFSCRGYTSQSELWRAGQRIALKEKEGKDAYILHFGDHDPSGVDMTRDIESRLVLFGAEPKVRRLALNMDQIDQYNPPPNPAKITDSRSGGYIELFGDESWELDALEPNVMVELARNEIESLIDDAAWAEVEKREEFDKEKLKWVSRNWNKLKE